MGLSEGLDEGLEDLDELSDESEESSPSSRTVDSLAREERVVLPIWIISGRMEKKEG